MDKNQNEQDELMAAAWEEYLATLTAEEQEYVRKTGQQLAAAFSSAE